MLFNASSKTTKAESKNTNQWVYGAHNVFSTHSTHDARLQFLADFHLPWVKREHFQTLSIEVVSFVKSDPPE